MQPFFSVIVTEHNAEKYMRKGLDSIINQTFTDYELIIICDACNDNTVAIAREYSNKVFEVDWANCGKTYNKGLEEVTGKWILFMDDDDWWATSDAFQIIANTLQNDEEYDMLAFGFIFGNNGYHATQSPKQLYYAPWSKAWRASFVGNTRFAEVPHSADVSFANATHSRAKIRFINDALYYYNYMRPGSISQMLSTGKLARLEEMGYKEGAVIWQNLERNQ